VTERPERSPRVRVTGPPRHRPAPSARTGEIDEQTALGEVYVDSLLRAQLGLALRVLAALAVTVGATPLVFHLWPTLVGHRLLGLQVSWLLLGVLVYPWLVLLGWLYVRRAERHERDFVLLLQVLDD
jgi:Flp pilus assembly protein TadB